MDATEGNGLPCPVRMERVMLKFKERTVATPKTGWNNDQILFAIKVIEGHLRDRIMKAIRAYRGHPGEHAASSNVGYSHGDHYSDIMQEIVFVLLAHSPTDNSDVIVNIAEDAIDSIMRSGNICDPKMVNQSDLTATVTVKGDSYEGDIKYSIYDFITEQYCVVSA